MVRFRRGGDALPRSCEECRRADAVGVSGLERLVADLYCTCDGERLVEPDPREVLLREVSG
jgi:hypothetical protein